MNYVGIDHHRQYSHLTVMDPGGQVLRSGRVPDLITGSDKLIGFKRHIGCSRAWSSSSRLGAVLTTAKITGDAFSHRYDIGRTAASDRIALDVLVQILVRVQVGPVPRKI